MLKIAIDCRHLQFYNEGISRVTLDLVRLLRNDFEIHALLSDRTISVPELELLTDVQRHYLWPSWSKLDWIWENYSLVKFLNRLKPALYHAPCTMGLPLKKIPEVRYVVTIHDLLIKYFPDSYPLLGKLKWRVGMRVNFLRADTIIAVSHYTKKLICQEFGIKEHRILVVPNMLSPIFNDYRKNLDSITTVRFRFNLRCDYIIYHGGFRLYKNVERVINAFNAFRKQSDIPLKLCLVGNHNVFYNQFVQPHIALSPYKSDIISTGYVPDNDLPFLLSGARCFVYLSKMEGFGFAPLEAMACGTPVLCAENSSMIETLGDNVIWIEKNETPKEIAKKISSLISNKPLAQDLIEKGILNASGYNQKQFKKDMINAYGAIVNN